jgi:hypothetical protein
LNWHPFDIMSLEGNDHASCSTPSKNQTTTTTTTMSQTLDEVDIDAFIEECHPYGVDDHNSNDDGEISTGTGGNNKINVTTMDENDDAYNYDPSKHSKKEEEDDHDDDQGEEEEDEDEENDSRVVVDPRQKRLFEQEKEEIMRTVPKAVKNRFGQIVFATFGSYIGPVLILDPYRISPGPVRDQWLKMYHKVSLPKSNRKRWLTPPQKKVINIMCLITTLTLTSLFIHSSIRSARIQED